MALPVQNISSQRLIPSVTAEDSDQVAVLLETAQVLFDNGDVSEALRWIRRAANLTAQEGRDERALTLARAAADFATEIGTASTPASVVARRPEALPSTTALSPASRVRQVARSTTPHPLTILPPAKPAEPPHADTSFESAEQVPQNQPLRGVSSEEIRDAGAGGEAELIERLIAEGRAVRVLVKRSARDRELYIVRKEGSVTPAPGTRKAIMLLSDIDPELFED